ncbi:hypothetical protein EUGRSUZ_I02707 [Eucalyptus grandis]|uniref:Uncharacterized protein n=2 Tax=Eucalyptus grandis TaxID=71139 RepID=A0ACC3JJG0_EUCGR|nr:hypothetical protein EUGRSUZ_I02707 [Eucalyptus grandis]
MMLEVRQENSLKYQLKAMVLTTYGHVYLQLNFPYLPSSNSTELSSLKHPATTSNCHLASARMKNAQR